MSAVIATINVAANTGPGTQDITTTALGGLTPKALILIATHNTSLGSAVDGSGLYIGVSDGTSHWFTSNEDEHAQATMDARTVSGTTNLLIIHDLTADGVSEATTDFDSWITNGVRINWTDAPPAAYLLTAIFFAGSDLEVKVGNTDLGSTADAAIDITTVGFEADDVIASLLVNDGANAHFRLGFAHNNRAGTVTQRSVSFVSKGILGASISIVGAMVREDALVTALQSTGVLDWYGVAESFDSSGFTVQLANGNSPGTNDICWLALRYGATPVISSKVYTYSTPTSASSDTDTGPGFEPQAVIYLPTFCEVAATSETDADGGTIGISVTDGIEEYCVSVQSEDNQADSDTQSMSAAQIIKLPTDAGTTGIEATLTGFVSNGVEMEFTAVQGTAKLFPAIAFGPLLVAGRLKYPVPMDGLGTFFRGMNG